MNLISQYEININYESGFEYKSQKMLLKDLEKESSRLGIQALIQKQDWIENYSIIYKPFKKKVYISIKNREPIFILNKEYFYDKNLIKFKYDQSNNELIKVDGDINKIKDVLFLIELVELNNLINFKINKIEYNFVSGWDVITESTLIRFGKDIPQDRVKNFIDTVNYLYEKKKIPSIIDMRYKDGVAIDYGK
jgi:cell division septal protein FtsQ|tara:strand:+ start:265 stop:843 length:579 start_codon:yes stop_codon:yes gene_type:complete